MINVIATSDLHGNLIAIKQKFDLLLICGDILPLKIQRDYEQSEKWIFNDFLKWINNLKSLDEKSKVVFIAGNHDFYFELCEENIAQKLFDKTGGRLIYLKDDGYTVYKNDDKYVIYGTPFCKPLYGWAFCKQDYAKHYKKIPNDIDILITHEALDYEDYGMSTEGRCKGRNFGSKELTEEVFNRIRPKYHFFGHIHSGNHNIKEKDGTRFANVSLLGEQYSIKYEPINIAMD